MRRAIAALLASAVPGAPILDPGDLAGRRVGLPRYWMTSSVWRRAVLFDEYGIDERAVR